MHREVKFHANRKIRLNYSAPKFLGTLLEQRELDQVLLGSQAVKGLAEYLKASLKDDRRKAPLK